MLKLRHHSICEIKYVLDLNITKHLCKQKRLDIRLFFMWVVGGALCVSGNAHFIEGESQIKKK